MRKPIRYSLYGIGCPSRAARSLPSAHWDTTCGLASHLSSQHTRAVLGASAVSLCTGTGHWSLVNICRQGEWLSRSSSGSTELGISPQPSDVRRQSQGGQSLACHVDCDEHKVTCAASLPTQLKLHTTQHTVRPDKCKRSCRRCCRSAGEQVVAPPRQDRHVVATATAPGDRIGSVAVQAGPSHK